jgi:molecular chaperone GrpE
MNKDQKKTEAAESEQTKWKKLAEAADIGSDDAEAPDSADQSPQLDFPSREELEEKLTVYENQVQKAKEQVLRVQAEMDNLRRRTERDVSNAMKFGSERLLQELLPVADSLTRALETKVPGSGEYKSLHEGVEMTLDMLLKVLVKNGIVLIEPKPGEAFNPHIHEAMATITSLDHKPGTIIEVVQKGYQLHDRVLRAAMVVVA